MTKRILVPVADGIEMVEALAMVDVFRRAGADVDIASVHDLVITSSHGVKIHADKRISDCMDEEYDLVVVPGGIPGAEHLRDSKPLIDILKKQNKANKLYGAICASPALVLGENGLLEGKSATCHPGFIGGLKSGKTSEKNVVMDQNCVTSRGAGTAVEFSLELLGILMGDEKKQEVAAGMVVEV